MLLKSTISAITLLFLVSSLAISQNKSLISDVDPNIGAAHSRWFFYTPAANPFGMAKPAAPRHWQMEEGCCNRISCMPNRKPTVMTCYRTSHAPATPSQSGPVGGVPDRSRSGAAVRHAGRLRLSR